MDKHFNSKKHLTDLVYIRRYGNAEGPWQAMQGEMDPGQSKMLNPHRVCPCVQPERLRRVNSQQAEQDWVKFLKSKPEVSTKGLYEREHMVGCKPNTPFNSYGISHLHAKSPMYRTTSQDYGYHAPANYHVPKRNFALTQTFSNGVCHFGMYRDSSLNMDTTSNK